MRLSRIVAPRGIEESSMTGFNDRLFERMQEMNRVWIERLREIRQIESDYGTRLLRAESSSEAATICHEWMAKRLETVAYEQKAFTTAWIALISDATKSKFATPIKASEHDKRAAS